VAFPTGEQPRQRWSPIRIEGFALRPMTAAGTSSSTAHGWWTGLATDLNRAARVMFELWMDRAGNVSAAQFGFRLRITPRHFFAGARAEATRNRI